MGVQGAGAFPEAGAFWAARSTAGDRGQGDVIVPQQGGGLPRAMAAGRALARRSPAAPLAGVLRLTGVRKAFFDPGRGPVAAIDGVDLALGDGVVALVGANGAGKSTLLRMVATLMRPDAGTIGLDGIDAVADAHRLRQRLGYLSTTTKGWPRLTGREVLRLTAAAHDLADADARIAALAERFAVGGLLDARMAALSTGQAQRFGLARALIADPDLLVLDEPTTGLDIVAARQFTAAVDAARRPGRLIIFASHVVAEVARLADRVIVLRAGRVAADGAPAAVAGGGDLDAALHALLAAPAEAAHA